MNKEGILKDFIYFFLQEQRMAAVKSLYHDPRNYVEQLSFHLSGCVKEEVTYTLKKYIKKKNFRIEKESTRNGEPAFWFRDGSSEIIISIMQPEGKNSRIFIKAESF